MGSSQTAAPNVPPIPLVTPHQFGPFALSHRVVLAPLTRCRAIGNVPQPAAATYYAQRASPGGFLITEATNISPTSYGYAHTPGIHTEEQIEAWKPIVQAVHDKGGIFFCQLWHVGRLSHNAYQPNGIAPVSSVAKQPSGQISLPDGTRAPYPVPRALETEEIPLIVQDYRKAARNAITAGFDGVEIHSAHGYLLDQFLKDQYNNRTDKYGGSLENCCRFTLEVVKAVVDEIDSNRVGIRISAHDYHEGVGSSDRIGLGVYLSKKLSELDILYIHHVEPRIVAGQVTIGTEHNLLPFREAFKNTFIVAGGYGREDGIDAIKSGYADLVVYGRKFLANPDLPRRFALNAPLNAYNRPTFYIQDQVKGYTDYPFLDDSKL